MQGVAASGRVLRILGPCARPRSDPQTLTRSGGWVGGGRLQGGRGRGPGPETPSPTDAEPTHLGSRAAFWGQPHSAELRSLGPAAWWAQDRTAAARGEGRGRAAASAAPWALCRHTWSLLKTTQRVTCYLSIINIKCKPNYLTLKEKNSTLDKRKEKGNPTTCHPSEAQPPTPRISQSERKPSLI